MPVPCPPWTRTTQRKRPDDLGTHLSCHPAVPRCEHANLLVKEGVWGAALQKPPTSVFSFLHRRGAFFLFDKNEKKEWGSQRRRASERYSVYCRMVKPWSTAKQHDPVSPYPGDFSPVCALVRNDNAECAHRLKKQSRLLHASRTVQPWPATAEPRLDCRRRKKECRCMASALFFPI